MASTVRLLEIIPYRTEERGGGCLPVCRVLNELYGVLYDLYGVLYDLYGVLYELYGVLYDL